MPAASSLLLISSDLFFVGKINSTAVEMGWTVRAVSSVEKLPTAAELAGFTNVLVDLELTALPVAVLAERVKGLGIHLVGYAPHVKQHLFDQAAEAGFDELLSRGSLAAGLVDRLREWGT